MEAGEVCDPPLPASFVSDAALSRCSPIADPAQLPTSAHFIARRQWMCIPVTSNFQQWFFCWRLCCSADEYTI
jgi:hypothetical protein